MTRTHRSHLSYIDASREYYAAMGYDTPYAWAVHDEVAFSRIRTPLEQARVGLVTTAALPGHRRREPFAAPTFPVPPRLVTDHLHWHHEATHTDDLGSFLPIDHLVALAEDGVIGSIAPRFHGIATVYSQRQTTETAHALVDAVQHDEVDLVVFAPL